MKNVTVNADNKEEQMFIKNLLKTIKTIALTLALIILVSEVGATTTVASKTMEVSNFSGSVTIIKITTDRLGNLIYIEKYYLIDNSGALKYDRGVKYYEQNIIRDKLTLEILRPNSSSGRPYPAILSTVIIDNQTVFQGWFKQYRQQKSEYQNAESQLIQNTQKQEPNQESRNIQKLSGFKTIAAIVAISTIYFVIEKKNKRRDRNKK